MSTLPVFQQLLLDNPNLFTTEGLSSLLHDCISLGYPENRTFTYPSLLDRRVYLSLAGFESTSSQETIHRIMADPKGWCMDAPEAVQEGAQYYQNMGQMLGPNFATNLFIYQTIRDNIQQLQKSMGISGVGQRYVSVRDQLFSYPTAEDQLQLLESDRVLLQSATPKLIQYFTELVQTQPAYNLFFVDAEEQKIPTTFSALEIAANKAMMAEIYTESFRWEQVDNCSWRGEPTSKPDPDKINLVLHLDWLEEEFLFFEAHHPDKSRFPWLRDRLICCSDRS